METTKTTSRIVFDERPLSPRTWARVINLDGFKLDDDKRVTAMHGGTVANAYKYPADTDAVLIIRLEDGREVVAASRIPANQATHVGAAKRGIGILAEQARRIGTSQATINYILSQTKLAAQKLWDKRYNSSEDDQKMAIKALQSLARLVI